MLDRVRRREDYNKAAMIRHISRSNGPGDTGPLAGRSRGSIEAKLMNASACHADMAGGDKAMTMDGHGYRCLPNYQRALRDAMRAELDRRSAERAYAADAAEYNATQVRRNVEAKQ
ncbi:MAG: hypothetical protein AMJ72_00025 [Acidithiobacillales bacterium SM1_46]|nr:MAG: hypothetical protein AMJ72_00025 [Acidithiobacillales bacterium SM1_46]